MDPLARRRFYRLTFFNILSNLTVPLVGLVDTAMLGHLPDIQVLGGVALGSILFDYVYYGLGFLRMGTTGLTAQMHGRNDTAALDNVFWRGTLVAAVLACGLLVFQDAIEWAGFALSAGDAVVKAHGQLYFEMRIWGAPAVVWQFVITGWLLGTERVGVVLLITMITNVCNVVLDYLFIIQYDMGAAGAGLATMLSQYASLAGAIVWLFFSGISRPKPAEIFQREGLLSLLKLNTDIFLRTLALISSFALFINISAYIGTLYLVVNSILQKIITASAYLIDGFAIAVETMAGNAYGRGDYGSIRRLVNFAIVNSLIFAAGFLGLLWIQPEAVVGLLTNHKNVIQSALEFLPWIVPYMIFAAPAWVFDGLFIGLTRGRTLRNSMVLALLVYGVAAGWAAYTRSNHAIWAALAVLGVMRLGTLWWAYWRTILPQTKNTGG